MVPSLKMIKTKYSPIDICNTNVDCKIQSVIDSLNDVVYNVITNE